MSDKKGFFLTSFAIFCFIVAPFIFSGEGESMRDCDNHGCCYLENGEC